MRRRNQTSPELRANIESRGVDAVNSDEDQDGMLDEQQQEEFIKQMTTLVNDYVRRWRSLFAWLSLMITVIHAMAFIGIFPLTATLVTLWEPRSIILQLLMTPFGLCVGFGPTHLLASALAAGTVAADWGIFVTCTRERHPHLRVIRGVALLVCVVWIALAYMTPNMHPVWGRHTVVLIATPLLAVAGEMFISSRTLATAGLNKLAQFKYSYRKP